MSRKRLAIPPVILILLLVGYGWYALVGADGSSGGQIEGSGTIESVDLNIGSQIAAGVLDVVVEEGQVVKKGERLIVLDDRLLKNQVVAARAGVEAAQAEVDDGGSTAERRIARAQLEQAKASLEMAEIQLGYAAVKSPTDGVVTSLPFSEGEVVSPGATLAVIGKTKELELTIYVDERELGQVKNGQKAVINVDAYPGQDFEGEVVEISSEAEFTPQNVQTKEQRSNLVFGVTIRIENPKGQLKAGMPADAVLE